MITETPLRILLATIGHAADAIIPVLSKFDGKPGFHTDWVLVDEADATAAKYAGEKHVWFGVQPITRPADARSRGKANDVTRMVTLYADLDYYDAEHKPTGMSPDVAMEIIAELADLLQMQPSALVASGNGIQPYWPIEPITDLITAASTLLRWRKLVIKVADAHGAEVDTGVYDLPRILRVPGPPNIKHGLVKPTGLLKPYTATRLTFEQLTTCFDSYLNRDDAEAEAKLYAPGDSDGSDFVFTRHQALQHMEDHALSIIRDTPWGGGSNFWKVLWERSMVMSNFVGMWEAEDLKDMIKKAILDGHGAPDDKNDRYQIALGFIKGRTKTARLPTEAELTNPFSPHADLEMIARRQRATSAYLEPVRAPYVPPVLDLYSAPDESEPDDDDLEDLVLTGRECDEVGRVEGELLDHVFSDPRFPMFGHLRHFARARRVSPVAALGVLLTRIAVAIPVDVVTPPLIGREGSVNAFLCLLGRPGTKKGASTGAAEAAVHIVMHHTIDRVFHLEGPPYSVKIGSGQGIAGQYVSRGRPDRTTGLLGPLIRERDAVLFTCNEVSDMTAKAAGASTLLQTLCEVWVAETLGSAYVDPTKRLPVAPMSYRAGFILHGQPDLMGPLLIDAASGGAPQRFLYLSVIDEHRPDNRPEAPGPISWSPPRYVRNGDQYVVTVCKAAARMIENHDARVSAGEADPLDGHALFARLKTAVAISACRPVPADTSNWKPFEVDNVCWAYAGQLHGLSKQKRDQTVDHLLAQKKASHRTAAQLEGHKEVVKAEIVEAQAVDKSRARIIEVLSAAPVYTITKRTIQQRCGRKWDTEAFDLLCTDGSVIWKVAPTGAARGVQEVTVYALATNA